MTLTSTALAGLSAMLGLAAGACVLTTDAATRLAEDVVESAASLRADSGAELTLVHNPRSWPAGCRREFLVDKDAGEALRVTLRKQSGAIEVVEVE